MSAPLFGKNPPSSRKPPTFAICLCLVASFHIYQTLFRLGSYRGYSSTRQASLAMVATTGYAVEMDLWRRSLADDRQHSCGHPSLRCLLPPWAAFAEYLDVRVWWDDRYACQNINIMCGCGLCTWALWVMSWSSRKMLASCVCGPECENCHHVKWCPSAGPLLFCPPNNWTVCGGDA